ncbi:hypothetical protein F511_38901 [Dorcoceras hygrometricum]|uniref:Uncharacterized protein n=1 Tax=Dorcoceras hygrometricum TaxID=472368 RepID=A0A2Z7CL98_9LAMI|nr:hypothetical protein F511_38901 [Dorcoceras hygrometricum]
MLATGFIVLKLACDCVKPSAESYEGKMLSYQLIQTTSFCNRQLQTPTAAGYPVVGRKMLATGFIALKLACDCAKPSAESYEGKTLSYQLIQTTSFCNRQLQTPTAARIDQQMKRSERDEATSCWTISRWFSVDDVFGDVITISRWFESSSHKNQQNTVQSRAFRRFPVVPSGCSARARLLPESSGFLAGLVVAQYKVRVELVISQGIQLAVGPRPLRLRNHNFGLAQRIMVKRLATSPHDPLGITDSACKNQLVVVSVQYGPFNTYIPIRSTTIGKSRVARDPIAMHTSWRSNSDIASVTRVSMTFRVVRTNLYNQYLGLIHSTNGNHLESPNEDSSIDHQVTIHLHAQNIIMFPTNETWYFASQMLVSRSGGLILILTAQSTRNEFRIHSNY